MAYMAKGFTELDPLYQNVFFSRFKDRGIRLDGSFHEEVTYEQAREVVTRINKSWTGPELGQVLCLEELSNN